MAESINEKSSFFPRLYRQIIIDKCPEFPQQSGVNCPASILYGNPDPAEFNLKCSLDTDLEFINVDFNEEPTASFATSGAKNIRHDFTFSFMSTELDRSLSFISVRCDGTDRLTPDMILKIDHNKFLVLEFTTCASSNEKVMTNALNSKVAKYMNGLNIRANEGLRIVLAIIVVSQTSILTNVDLGNQLGLISYICSRYRASESIVVVLNKAGISIHSEDESSKISRIKNIMESISAVGPKFNEDMCFNNELWNNREYISPNFEMNFIKKCKEKIDEIANNQLRDPPDVPDELELEEKCWNKLWLEADSTNTRFDKKNVLNLPYMLVDKCEEWKGTHIRANEDLPYFSFGDTAETRILYKVFQKIRIKDYEYIENESGEYDIAMDWTKIPADAKEKRGMAKKMEIEIDPNDEQELSKKGWNGKKHRMKIDVQTYRQDKKRSFDLNTDVDDIDDYINDVSQHYPDLEPLNDDRMELIKSAWNVNPDDAKWIREQYMIPSLELMMGTPYYKAMHMISNIASELAISLRHHVKSNQIIIKRIRDYPVFLIIKPSHSEGPMGFILCVPKDYVQTHFADSNVYRPLKENGDWYYTEFVTTNVSKLNNWIKSDSMYIALYSFCADYWSVRLPLNPHGDSMTKVYKLLNFLMMIHLHDKKSTEELITLHRYIALEGFKMFPELCRPFEMYKDFNSNVHNRLSLWVMKKLRIECQRLVKIKTYYSSHKNFKVNAFRCPFINECLSNPYQLIQIFYYGYLCNKEENPERNTLTKLIVKVVEEEEKLPKNPDGSIRYDYLGHYEPNDLDDLGVHEFSPSMVIYLCNYFKNKMSETYNINYMEVLERRIYSALARENLEDLATQKASSNFDSSKYKHDFKTYSRSRTSIKIAEKLKPDTSMTIDLIQEAFNHFDNNDDCMHICLFPKAQHAGTREIYVMEIYARIIQRIIECISSTICQDIPSEMLVHPKNKYTAPDVHRRRIKKSCHINDDIIETAISADAKRWSQRHHASKFFIMLCQFTPKVFHTFLFNALKLWEKKRIMIDVRLLNLLDDLKDKTSNFLTSNSTLEKLLNGYTGKENISWMPGGCKSSYIQIQSGMMQGVLHYSSSLLHSIYLEWFQDFVLGALRRDFIKCFKSFQVFTYHMQSSDDSSLVLAIAAPNLTPSDYMYIFRRTSIIYRLKGELSKWIAIYPSEKKEKLNTLRFMEFNSEFYVESSVYKATDKFVFAAVRMSECETMIGKQEENYNLITSIPENGGSFMLASFVQVSQALLHYRTIGYQTSCLFEKWQSNQLYKKDPSAGFYLLDECIAAGVAGVRYLTYQACKSSYHLQNKFKTMLDSFYPLDELTDEENRLRKVTGEILCNALSIRATTVPICNTRKWQSAINKLESNSLCDWREYIETDPSCIYRRADNGLETYSKIMAKMHSPGVPQSFSNRNSLSRVMAMGAYILSRPVVHVREKDQSEDSPLLTKTSIRSLLSWSEETYKGNGMSAMDFSFIFPQEEEYLNLEDRIACFREKSGLFDQKMDRKRIRSMVSVYASEQDYYIDPVKIISDKWFKRQSSHLSDTTIEYHYNRLQSSIKWLKDNPFDTLRASPFSDQIKMKNYFSSLNEKRRSLRLNSTPAKSHLGKANLVSAMMYDPWGEYKFVSREDPESSNIITLFHQSQNSIYHYMMFPKDTETWEMDDNLRQLLIRTVPDVECNPRSTRAAYQIAKMVANHAPKQDIMHKIHNYQMGCIGAWTTRQTKNESTGLYKGQGIWVGSIGGVATRVFVFGSDKNLLLGINIGRSLTNEEASQFLTLFTDWCKEEKITYDWEGKTPDDNVMKYMSNYRMASAFAITPKRELITGKLIKKEIHPIAYISPKLVFMPDATYVKRFYIQCYSNILRIKVDMTNFPTPINVLRLIVRVPSVDCGINYNALQSIDWDNYVLQAWMFMKPLTISDAHDCIDDAISCGYDNSNSYPSFIRELLTRLFIESGVMSGELDLSEDKTKEYFCIKEYNASIDRACIQLFGQDTTLLNKIYRDKESSSQINDKMEKYVDLTSHVHADTMDEFSEPSEQTSRLWLKHPLFSLLMSKILEEHRHQVKSFFNKRIVCRPWQLTFWFHLCCFVARVFPSAIRLINEFPGEVESDQPRSPWWKSKSPSKD